jgi:hypothetical protein
MGALPGERLFRTVSGPVMQIRFPVLETPALFNKGMKQRLN